MDTGIRQFIAWTLLRRLAVINEEATYLLITYLVSCEPNKFITFPHVYHIFGKLKKFFSPRTMSAESTMQIMHAIKARRKFKRENIRFRPLRNEGIRKHNVFAADYASTNWGWLKNRFLTHSGSNIITIHIYLQYWPPGLSTVCRPTCVEF